MRSLVLLPLFFVCFLSNAQIQPYVQYGSDDRKDIYELSSPTLRDLAHSTVALAYRRDLRTTKEGGYRMKYLTNQQANNLCSDELFLEQPTTAFCSGFLYDKKHIITAKHCVLPKECEGTAIIFDYTMKDAQNYAEVLPRNQVYFCKQRKVLLDGRFDAIMLELDRPVQDRNPLVVSSQTLSLNDAVFIIGYPLGLPAKYSGNASVRSFESSKMIYRVNADVFAGNSGAPVFNAHHQVAGILIEGEEDFTYDRSRRCYKTRYCTDKGCDGEEVLSLIKADIQ